MAQVVMELAGNAVALRFLTGDEASRQIMNAPVACGKGCLVIAQPLFRAPAPRALHEESRDERHLREKHQARADDVLLVVIQEGGYSASCAKKEQL